MTYELAKRLRDAGYPQVYFGDRFYYTGENTVLPFIAIKHLSHADGTLCDYERDLVMIPTLEDLIGSCIIISPTNFYLRLNGDEWLAFAVGDTEARAANPIVAVAELWLKLKKNNETI